MPRQIQVQLSTIHSAQRVFYQCLRLKIVQLWWFVLHVFSIGVWTSYIWIVIGLLCNHCCNGMADDVLSVGTVADTYWVEEKFRIVSYHHLPNCVHTASLSLQPQTINWCNCLVVWLVMYCLLSLSLSRCLWCAQSITIKYSVSHLIVLCNVLNHKFSSHACSWTVSILCLFLYSPKQSIDDWVQVSDTQVWAVDRNHVFLGVGSWWQLSWGEKKGAYF